MRRLATVNQKACVACGCCVKVCRKQAISVNHGKYAQVDETLCVGCGICAKECPASIISLRKETL